jgi:hypothetical protein
VLAGSGFRRNLKGLTTGSAQQNGAAGDNPLDTVLGVLAALQTRGAQRVVAGLNPVDIVTIATVTIIGWGCCRFTQLDYKRTLQ